MYSLQRQIKSVYLDLIFLNHEFPNPMLKSSRQTFKNPKYLTVLKVK